MRVIVLLIGLLATNSGPAQDGLRFALTPIDEELKKNAHSVFRIDEATLDVLSPSGYRYTVHQVVTILNPEGAYHLRHSLHYDKFRTVDDVEITVYNNLGKTVKKYSKKDFETQAAYDGISLVTDDKVMRLQTPAPGYPCTVETKYTIIAKGYIDLPDWYINNHQQSVELFRYIVTVPAELDIRHRAVNCDLKPVIETMGEKKKYTWETRNIRVGEWQSEGFQPRHYFPGIEIAPNLFEYDRHKGSFRSWADFGKWNLDLYQEKEPFTKERAAEIKAMAAKESTLAGKVSLLYEYLKENTRYVSIQLGIGGFKPFPVRFVDEKKYGDCKALTNYMRQLLELEGIKSYPALINAGYDDPPVDPEFPTTRFNHVILCVPNKGDTIWLECTSKDNEAGFLGSFTENKNALLITEEGGIMVRTPASSYERNRFSSYSEIQLHPDGAAAAKTRISCTGDFLPLYREIQKTSADEQKEIFVNHLKYRLSDVFAVMEKGDRKGQGLQMSFHYDKFYDFKAGNKYFLSQKLHQLATEDLKDQDRKIEYLFEYPFLKTDTSVYTLPEGFGVEALPPLREIENEYASYKKTASFDAQSNKLTITTTLVLKKQVIPAAGYKKMVQFFKAVREDEAEKIILKTG